jgi:thiamine biosynthesis lipoprotein
METTNKNNKRLWQWPFLLLLIVGTVWILRKQAPFQTAQGLVFGTIYQITYQYDGDLQPQIEEELRKVDFSLSPFNKESLITHINQNEDVTVDTMFTDVYMLARRISGETNGAFDITVAPLVNAWGFGFRHQQWPDSTTIDSLRRYIDYRSVTLTADGRIQKQHPETMLDCSAIAKGYGVDAVARLLDRKGVKNYMVDIGGEVVVKGKNPKMNLWRIGINKPDDDSLSVNQDLQDILNLTDRGMATSGNYRNFYYRDGKKYAHTIDPRTGYPVQHSLLSATVLAATCAEADAYATAFMVMGVDEATAFCRQHPEIEAYFIFAADSVTYGTTYTEGMKQYLH